MISSPSPFWQEFLLCASTVAHTEQGFLLSALPDAHTVPAARARGNFMPILCLAAKNRRRKGIKGQAP